MDQILGRFEHYKACDSHAGQPRLDLNILNNISKFLNNLEIYSILACFCLYSFFCVLPD